MKYFAVIDTNVLVSALLKENSIPWKVIEYVKSSVITPIFNKDILLEYRDVLYRNNFDFDTSVVEETIQFMMDHGVNLQPVEINEFFNDKKDVVFYQIVMSGRQSANPDTKLVTGNIKHFPVKDFIVTPRQMIEIIENEQK